ncbi:MAG: heavy-metal-associated domain-containing protein [Crocinitomicaceae bacterium]
MRKISTVLTVFSLLFLFSCENTEGYITEKFTVYGNCGMCKKTIEGSLNDSDGISTAEWNMSNDQMMVFFDPKSISLEEIHAKIAAVGYDTEEAKASDEVYEKLHSCCKYERPE